MRVLLFLGDKISAGALFPCRDAARVDLAAGADALAAAAGCLEVAVAARERFLGTARSMEAFSLSSLAASSLERFLPRVDAVGTDLDAACLATGLAGGFGAFRVAARDKVGTDRAFAGGACAGAGALAVAAVAAATAAAAAAAAFFVGAFLAGAALAGAGAGFG